MDSLRSFWDAVVAFGEAITAVSLGAVAIALGFHLLGMFLRSIAWRNIIRAGLGGTKVPLGPVAGGLMAGVGLNGIVPARGGDVLKVFLVRTRVAKTNYPMLTASLVAETLFNAVMALVLLMWAWWSGRLPSGPELPGISAFEISWAAQHPAQAMFIVLVMMTMIFSTIIKYRPQLEQRWHQVKSGVQVLSNPRDYVTLVLVFQACAWAAQVTTAWFFLDAFGIPSNLANALTVVLIQGFGSVLLVTPGGVGPKQALTVVFFASQAPQSTILAFSAGMEVILVAFQLAVGLIAAGRLLGGFRIRQALAQAREERLQAAGPTDSGPTNTVAL